LFKIKILPVFILFTCTLLPVNNYPTRALERQAYVTLGCLSDYAAYSQLWLI